MQQAFAVVGYGRSRKIIQLTPAWTPKGTLLFFTDHANKIHCVDREAFDRDGQARIKGGYVYRDRETASAALNAK